MKKQKEYTSFSYLEILARSELVWSDHVMIFLEKCSYFLTRISPDDPLVAIRKSLLEGTHEFTGKSYIPEVIDDRECDVDDFSHFDCYSREFQ